MTGKAFSLHWKRWWLPSYLFVHSQWSWYVYIIECLDGTYYTGCTWNVAERFDQHLAGLGAKYTAKHGVKKLVYYEQLDDLETARLREKQIKDWSQAKKKRLISGEWRQEW